MAAVQRMTAAGVTTFVEVGPGKVLAGLVRRIDAEVDVIAIDDITSEGGLTLPTEVVSEE